MQESPNYKVKVAIGDTVVEIEGQEEGVVKIVSALAKILEPKMSAREPVTSKERAATGATAAGQDVTRPVDIRTFFSDKRPTTDIEAATVVAFYYQNLAPLAERQEAINPDTLEKAFRLARWPLPSNARYTLVNARNAGYLDSTPQAGYYRLNPVGYNLVEHTLGGVRDETTVTAKPLTSKKRIPKTKKKATAKGKRG